MLDCDLNNAVFIKSSNNNYQYDNVYNKVEFDGTINTYKLLINGYLCITQTVEAGFIYGEYDLDFYDVTGNVVSNVVMKIKVVFLSGKTELNINVVNNNDSLSYLYNYMLDNGLQISVSNIKEIKK